MDQVEEKIPEFDDKIGEMGLSVKDSGYFFNE